MDYNDPDFDVSDDYLDGYDQGTEDGYEDLWYDQEGDPWNNDLGPDIEQEGYGFPVDGY